MKKIETVVGILTFSRLDFFSACLNSIYKTIDFEKWPNTQIVVANNSSDDEYIKKVQNLSFRPNITVINFNLNTGTSIAWNAISRMFDCKDVFIFNDDILVYPHWFEAGKYVLSKKEVGFMSFNHTTGSNPPKSRELKSIDFNQLIWYGPISYPYGSDLGFRREVFDEIGGFDIKFWMYLEEVDFGVRCVKAGYQNHNVGYRDYFFTHHIGGGTGGPAEYSPEVDYLNTKHNLKWTGGINLEDIR